MSVFVSQVASGLVGGGGGVISPADLPLVYPFFFCLGCPCCTSDEYGYLTRRS